MEVFDLSVPLIPRKLWRQVSETDEPRRNKREVKYTRH